MSRSITSIGDKAGEGPKVVRWRGKYWMVVDQWEELYTHAKADRAKPTGAAVTDAKVGGDKAMEIGARFIDEVLKSGRVSRGQTRIALVANRVRPYYIYQCDLVAGAGHFRTPVSKGLEIIEAGKGAERTRFVGHTGVVFGVGFLREYIKSSYARTLEQIREHHADMVADNLGPGAIHHSDQGVQYAAGDYVRLLQDREVAISMADVGAAWQNGYAERLVVRHETVVIQ